MNTESATVFFFFFKKEISLLSFYSYLLPTITHRVHLFLYSPLMEAGFD